MNDLDSWLDAIGCQKHAAAFRENDITFDLLAELTDADLKELGLNLGDRKRVLRAVAAQAGDTPEPPPTDEDDVTPHAERRRITVMFVDLVGSTELATRQDPEVWSETLKAYQDVVAGVVTRFDGIIAQFLGDGVLCYFGWPRAREDSAERAIEAGLEIVRSVARLKAGDDPIECRLGVATGLVVVGDLIGRSTGNDEVAIGGTMNYAARLQGYAQPGRIVISDSTRELVGGAFLLEHLGEQRFKGIDEEQQIFSVVSHNPAHERFDRRAGEAVGEIVERETELSLLTARWRQAQTGEGQVVLLIGEAGIGKSRICHSMLRSIEGSEHTQITLQCAPYLRDTALWPVTNFLVNASGIRVDDGPDERRAKMERFLTRSDASQSRSFGVVASLLNIPQGDGYSPPPETPSARRAAYLRTLVDLLLNEAKVQPLLLRVEDAHWIDPTTMELLNEIIGRIENQRILLLITSRPEGRPTLASGGTETSITLNRLGRRAVAEIISRLGGADLPAEVVEAIIDRADGVPLFAEELTKAMIERGDMSVPASLHDTLMARLDRLPGVKEIAQTGSVFGREFRRDLLSNVVNVSDETLGQALDDLVKVELIFPRDLAKKRYFFKHALVRDAAYESLLNRNREELHGRIFDVLTESGHTSLAVLAHHAAQAKRKAEAIDYGRRAADEALRRPAYAEAITQLDKTLALTTEEADRAARTSLLLLLGPAQIAYLGYAAAPTQRTYDELQRLAVDTNDNVLLIEGLYGHWAGAYVPGRTRDALDIADRICSVAETADDDLATALGFRLRGSVLTMMGRVEEANAALSKVSAVYDPARHAAFASRFGQDVGVAGACYRLGNLTLEGRFDAAAELALWIVEELKRVNHAHTSGYSLGHVACFLAAAGIEPLGSEIAEECIAISERDSMPLWSALARASRAIGRAEDGDPTEMIPIFRAALDGLSAVDFNVFRTLYLPSFAMVLARNGEIKEAEAQLDEARRLVNENGTAFYEAEITRISGRIALEKGDAALAEKLFLDALDIAGAKGHLAWELRAAIDYEKISRSTPRRADGRARLNEILGRFSEGRDLPPLTEAASALAATA